LGTTVEDEVSCCYAVQDKVWVDSPDGSPWEIYTVLADSDADSDADVDVDTDVHGEGGLTTCC
jgi:hypothetical protein